MTNKTIQLLPYQMGFLNLECPNAALIASVGTGKTLTIAHSVVKYISEYPKSKGMIVSNTYSQLNNSTLGPLFELLDELSIPYKKNISGKYITVMNTKVYVYSLENFTNIRGVECGWILADELAFQKTKEAYDVIKTRLRCKHGPLYFRAFSTKNGFNWFYDLYASPTKAYGFEVIEAQTKDNQFLPPQYLDDLLLDYGSVDAPMYKQEVLNEYVNLTEGSVYYAFDREKHVMPVKLDKKKHLNIGLDFNIDRLSGVYAQMRGDILYVGNEVFTEQHNINTFDLADRLQLELFEYNFRSVIPDSTGKARKSSSSKSDHQILRDAGFKLEETTNPRIRDRQNAVNRLFNQGKLVIDPKCKELIKELETLSQRDDEGKVSHISVALGYIVWKLDPLQRKAKQARQIKF